MRQTDMLRAVTPPPARDEARHRLVHRAHRSELMLEYKGYIGEVVYDARFAVAARQREPAWRPLDPALDLGAILAFRHTRTVARDNTVKYHWRTLQLLPSPQRPSYAGARVDVLERPSGELAVRHQGETIPSRLAPPRSGVLRERRSELACDPALEHIASGLGSGVAPPDQPGFLPRRTGPPSPVPHRRPGSSRCARPPRASRSSGRPSARHNCRGSRCAPSPACSASPATRSAAMCSPAGERGGEQQARMVHEAVVVEGDVYPVGVARC